MAQVDINKQTDMFYVYNQLLDGFRKLYPDKNLIVNEIEAELLIKTFCNKLRKDNSLFSLLINRDNKLFKGLKCTLIPKYKMEVILKNDEDNKMIVANMWNNIWLLYLLGEATTDEPNKINMSRIAFALDLNSKSPNEENKIGNLFNAFQNADTNEIEKMISSVGISKEQIDELKNGLNSDQVKDLLGNLDINNLSNLDFSSLSGLSGLSGLGDIDLSGISLKPTDNSNKFLSDILTDLKTNFNLNNVEGKVNSKDFVEQLLNVGNSLSDTYGKKLSSGELSINDILGGITSIASNPDQNVINDLTESLNFDKLDMNEIIGELKGKLNGKLPPELLSTLGSLDGDSLKNLNIGNLIGSMFGGKEEEAKELTLEQKTELLDYYSNLEL